VLCGGKSSRMGEDKCFLNYHGKAQCYYVYDMLQKFCSETFISCNADQSTVIDRNFKTLEDIDSYANKGPATGVLTAFSAYPDKDFLVIACDYPLLAENDISHFLESFPANSVAAAFYDDYEQCYHPVIAWYSSEAGALLMQSSQNAHFSLKSLLQSTNAYKHSPVNPSSLMGVDTKEDSRRVIQLTNNNH
jgi:molybdenum cofactor guanylyltransferase